MAVGLRIKFDGGTEEQYKAIHSHLSMALAEPQELRMLERLRSASEQPVTLDQLRVQHD